MLLNLFPAFVATFRKALKGRKILVATGEDNLEALKGRNIAPLHGSHTNEFANYIPPLQGFRHFEILDAGI